MKNHALLLLLMFVFLCIGCKNEIQWSKKSSRKMNWVEAANYCEYLNQDGYSDWRLPNIDELRTLIKNCPKTEPGGECKVSTKSGCLSKDCIESYGSCRCDDNDNDDDGKYSDFYKYTRLWSSDTKDYQAWSVNFDYASIELEHHGLFPTEEVICVRENSADNKKPTDINLSNLQWSKSSQDNMNWNEAINYCKNLREDENDDWRLPSVDELRTVIKNCPTETGGECKVTNQCLSDSCWKTVCEKRCENSNALKSWSSSTYVNNADYAWYVDDYAQLTIKQVKNKNSVHCVRNNTGNKAEAENAESAKKSKTPELQWSSPSYSKTTWKEAVASCERLNANGYSDWRLPSIDELRTLIQNHPGTMTGGTCKISQKAEAMDVTLRLSGDCEGSGYGNFSKLGDENWMWSSTSFRNVWTYDVWGIDFYNGGIAFANQERKEEHYYRCVRGGKPPKKTKLWSSRSTYPMNWKSAINYCNNLYENGFSDWHLPTIDELRTLVQNHPGTKTGGYCRISQKAGYTSSRAWTYDCQGKAGYNFSKLGDKGVIWSSTIVYDNYNKAWVIRFDDGLLGHNDIVNGSYVRCTRN